MGRSGREIVFAAALTLAAAAVLTGPARSQTHAPTIEQARTLISQHDYKAAISVLDELNRANPRDAHVLVLRGDAKDYLGDEAGAIADYDAALAIDPDYEYAYATKCYSEVEIEKIDRAIADCSHAISLNPKDGFAYRGRANAEYLKDDYAAAFADADRAVALNDTDAYAFLTRCRANSSLGRLQEAKDDCTRSISIAPTDSAYFTRGQVLVKVGDYAGAASDLSETLKLNPGYSPAHYWLAVCEAAQKNVPAALTDVNAYLSAQGSDPDGLFLRAVLEAKQGKLQATRADAQEALRQFKLANDQDGARRAQSLLDSLPKQ
ncbi:MAG TPA: tetratricopeptide repeat protein [Candidatus Baltobacteraceae bacterium]|jgi:tetratricopeptide (TPR) repeat protein|nr:tetratricopeptide repeat protein [Candidatus Baltobacteraceae bacterium]